MADKTDKLLADIEIAGAAINAFFGPLEVGSLRNDLLLRSAVERQLEIIGEAVRRLRDHDPLVVVQIPEWQRIIGLRKILTHNYDGVDANALVEVVATKLPELRAAVGRLRVARPKA
jgi:uncharacterized protein with HEPN domain